MLSCGVHGVGAASILRSVQRPSLEHVCDVALAAGYPAADAKAAAAAGRLVELTATVGRFLRKTFGDDLDVRKRSTPFTADDATQLAPPPPTPSPHKEII